MNTSDKALVETIARSKLYRDYEAAFRAALGLPLTFTPVETLGLPLHDDPNESPFCALMAGVNKSCAACLQTHARLAAGAHDDTATEQCFSGLCDSAVPVKLGDRVIGLLRTGHVFTHPPTEGDFSKTVETLAQWGVPVNLPELRAAYFASKIVTPEQFQAVLRMLKVFAEHLSSVSNQILVAEESAENPQIARAKEYIAENIAEDISLADCARVAHMSTFYFCKMFRRGTGLAFTEYLSRLRTEKARERLMDAQVRVSEVAFEVGFQSLSQFNRVFKKVTGQSPSEYRAALHANASRPERMPERAMRPFKFGVPARPAPSLSAPGAKSAGSRIAVA